MRTIQGIDAYGSTSFSDLCFFPNLKLPYKFKTPEFDKYNGKGCPFTHLRIYCGEMCQYGDDERNKNQQFQKSRTAPALTWFFQLDHNKIKTWSDLANAFLAQYRFNTEMAPDRYELQRTQKKSSESFRTYAQRWRKTAAQVKPPMLEKEMVTTFLNTLKDPYYAHLIGHTTSSFSDLVIVGERVEDGVKSGRLIDTHLLQTLMEQQSGTGTGPRKSVAKRQDIGQKNADIQMITTGQPPRRDFPQNQAVYVQPAASPYL